MPVTTKHLRLRSPEGGEEDFSPGWSWSMFLFSGLLGLPLYRRGLWGCGLLFTAIGAPIFWLGYRIRHLPSPEEIIDDVLAQTPIGAPEIELQWRFWTHPAWITVYALISLALVLLALQLWMGKNANRRLIRLRLSQGWTLVDGETPPDWIKPVNRSN